MRQRIRLAVLADAIRTKQHCRPMRYHGGPRIIADAMTFSHADSHAEASVRHDAPSSRSKQGAEIMAVRPDRYRNCVTAMRQVVVALQQLMGQGGDSSVGYVAGKGWNSIFRLPATSCYAILSPRPVWRAHFKNVKNGPSLTYGKREIYFCKWNVILSARLVCRRLPGPAWERLRPHRCAAAYQSA